MLDGQTRRSGDAMGHWVEALEPMHRTVCEGRPCRPGEGNLKGYHHWSQPYEPPSDEGKIRYAPFGVGDYAPLISRARAVAREGFVVFAAADYDYREMVENWWRSAQRAKVAEHALVYCLDAESMVYLSAKGLATVNGTSNYLVWMRTRLHRHIQRALAERHTALLSLAEAGLDVLLTDASHVFLRPGLQAYFAQHTDVDVLVQRGKCNPAKHVVGCSLVWNFLFLRGSAPAERRTRISGWLKASVNLGMVDFYLRWWMGHHCIFMGYDKSFRAARPTLTGGRTPADVAASPSQLAIVTLGKSSVCGATASLCLSVGLLPADVFPGADYKASAHPLALVGRVNRPEARHRLRLDRYDELDFDSLVREMRKQDMWLP
uniref:Nucleotide-diphospho-sugar transferase domain-containing protein n=1 Tax=Coccolithus braarudii TaxID=221442 RepID=A0A7S0L4Y5_9EUKA